MFISEWLQEGTSHKTNTRRNNKLMNLNRSGTMKSIDVKMGFIPDFHPLSQTARTYTNVFCYFLMKTNKKNEECREFTGKTISKTLNSRQKIRNTSLLPILHQQEKCEENYNIGTYNDRREDISKKIVPSYYMIHLWSDLIFLKFDHNAELSLGGKDVKNTKRQYDCIADD